MLPFPGVLSRAASRSFVEVCLASSLLEIQSPGGWGYAFNQSNDAQVDGASVSPLRPHMPFFQYKMARGSCYLPCAENFHVLVAMDRFPQWVKQCLPKAISVLKNCVGGV